MTSMAEVPLIDALTMAMAWELEHDSRVVVLGEDVGVNGGVFRATAGLQKRFGEDRVQDTPLGGRNDRRCLDRYGCSGNVANR